MKKYWISAATLALLTASVGALAHRAHMGQPHGDAAQVGADHQAMLSPEMQALQKDMQAKLAAAKTPQEREALMKEQHEKMRDKMPEMMGAAGMPHMPMGQMGQMGRGQGMNGMGPMNMRHHPMMQEQRPQTGG